MNHHESWMCFIWVHFTFDLWWFLQAIDRRHHVPLHQCCIWGTRPRMDDLLSWLTFTLPGHIFCIGFSPWTTRGKDFFPQPRLSHASRRLLLAVIWWPMKESRLVYTVYSTKHSLVLVALALMGWLYRKTLYIIHGINPRDFGVLYTKEIRQPQVMTSKNSE